MIELTALHYKVKIEALERYHNIAEHNQGLMFTYETELDKARDLNGEYPTKPFIEPFEFRDEDYIVTEKKFRIRKKDIILYKENVDNIVEVMVSEELTYTVKQTVEEMDKLFENKLHSSE
jgi:CRISPR/Cas system-associated exonuclease Cas4 (RecB family)